MINRYSIVQAADRLKKLQFAALFNVKVFAVRQPQC